MTRASEIVTRDLLKAFDSAIEKGDLPRTNISDAAIERPQNTDHGDFATSLPLKLASDMKMSPMVIAEILSRHLPKESIILASQVAPPGFLNLTLDPKWLFSQIHLIRNAKTAYGNLNLSKRKKIQIEYVSANPTGRLHVAHARGAVIGSALANLLKAAGHTVEEEYYLNDAGNQIEKFNKSLLVRYKQIAGLDIKLPEDSYPGEDISDVAKTIWDEEGDRYLQLDESEAEISIGSKGIPKMIEGIKEDLESLRVQFDEWFSETSLYKQGQFETCMRSLNNKGLTTDRDGAKWLVSTKLGEEKDNVLIRTSGTPTYFASDIAYHFNKFHQRNFAEVIDVWGADHQGQIGRLRSALDALEIDSTKLKIILVQMVRFKKGETSEKLSKRKGNVIPLIDLVNEIGVDACRFLFLSRSNESQLEFDLDLAKQQSSENPVYYVQYGHARICSILRLAEERNIDFSSGDVSILRDPTELSLINKMLELPDVIETSVGNLEAHHLPHYSMELATAFHTFYQNCRVVSSEKSDLPISKARLLLVDAARLVLGRCLKLMNMTAPDKM
ncbi:arginine--tRNA ligase [SAR202 cluster bacterium AD-802-K11_MRT_200m]|nr:arginine--tRNA ligase [SAR202 cluster bacterium AD-802-K11_MRT_200m]